MALYGEFTEDDIYRTPQSFIRLVTRAKTKFDESGKCHFANLSQSFRRSIKAIESTIFPVFLSYIRLIQRSICKHFAIH